MIVNHIGIASTNAYMFSPAFTKIGNIKKKHLNPKCLCVVCPLLKTMLPGVLETSSERATGDTLRETHETVQMTNDM